MTIQDNWQEKKMVRLGYVNYLINDMLMKNKIILVKIYLMCYYV